MVQECGDQVQAPKVGDHKSGISSPLGDHQFASNVFKACNAQNAGDAAKLGSMGFPTDVFTHKEPHQPTLDKEIRDRDVKRLTPEEQKAYQKENADRQAHEIGTMHEKAPPQPMHDKVDRQVKKEEQEAKDRALNSMTPQQREQLKQEQENYNKQWNETYHNGHGKLPWASDPEKGPTMQEYDRRVAKEARKDLAAHPN